MYVYNSSNTCIVVVALMVTACIIFKYIATVK